MRYILLLFLTLSVSAQPRNGPYGGSSGSSGSSSTNLQIVSGRQGNIQLLHTDGSYTNFFGTSSLNNGAMLAQAVTLATNSDTIRIDEACDIQVTNTLTKNGINYSFAYGVRLWKYATTNDPWGIFDDRQAGAGCTNKVFGRADLFFSQGTNGGVIYQGLGGIMLTNALSDLRVSFNDMSGESFVTDGAYPAVAYISNCAYCSIKAERIYCSRLNTDLTGTGVLGANLMGGVYWSGGELYLTFDYLGQFNVYAIWPNETVGTTTANMWVKGNFCEGYIYASVTSPTFRSWYDIIEMKRGTNGLTTAGIAVIGGSHYFKIDKISNTAFNGTASQNDYLLNIAGSARVWFNAQKLSITNNSTGFLSAKDSEVYLNVLQWEDLGTNANNRVIIDTDGVGGGKVYLMGGTALFSANGINMVSGYASVEGMTICTTNVNSALAFPIKKSGGQLNLVGSRLIAPAACTNAIFASTAQTVGWYWSAANKTNNSNITLSPNAGYTIDPNVR